MVDIIYVRQKYMLGLGNAIMCVKDIVKDEPFAVILPDDIILSEIPVTKQLMECYDKVERPVISLMLKNLKKIRHLIWQLLADIF